MRNLAAVTAILAIVVAVSAAYEGGRWIGSLVELGVDVGAPGAGLGNADAIAAPGVAVRREIEVREVRAAEEEARRRADEAAGALDPGSTERDAWLQVMGDRCRNWLVMTEEGKLQTADVLTVGIADGVREVEGLDADVGWGVAMEKVAMTIDETCEASPPDRELIDVTISLYGAD